MKLHRMPPGRFRYFRNSIPWEIVQCLKIGDHKYLFLTPLDFNLLSKDDQEQIRKRCLDYEELCSIQIQNREAVADLLQEIHRKVRFVLKFFESPEWKYGWKSKTFEVLDSLWFRIYLHQPYLHECRITGRAVFRYLKDNDSADRFLIELLGKELKELDEDLEQFLKDYDFAVAGDPCPDLIRKAFQDLFFKIERERRSMQNSLNTVQKFFQLTGN